MTYFHKCIKCGRNFLTGELADVTCCICDGSFPSLTYYEVEKE